MIVINSSIDYCYFPYLLADISVLILFQAGGFKLPFIVMGGLLLSILPVVLVILPKDESEYFFQ